MKKGRILALILTFALLGVAFAFGLNAFAADEAPAPGSKGEIDVWLIGGQSNAVGYSKDLPYDVTADSRYTDGFDNVLYYGYHEGNTMEDFTEVTVKGVPKSTPTSGAEIGIASVLGNSDRMSAVIKCATGSTKLYPMAYRSGATDARKTWTSPSYLAANGLEENEYIGALYTDFLVTVIDGLNLLIEDGYTPVIKGMLWAQGGAETNDVVDADGNVLVTADTMSSAYQELLTTLISDMRNDLAELADDASLNGENPMPFGIVKLTKNPTSSSYEESIPYVANINAAQTYAAENVKNAFLIDPTEAYGFGQHDGWHYNANTQKHIGEQFVAGVLTDKYLVRADGANVKIDAGMEEAGKELTVRFTVAKGSKIYSVTKTVNGVTENITLAGNNTYTFIMPDSEVRFTVTLEPTLTEYGAIPAIYSDTEVYPWVVFDKDKNFVLATDDFTIQAASAASAAGDGAVILLRRDLCMYDERDAYGGASLSNVNGSITVDLGGFVMEMGKEHGADAFIRMEPCIAGATTTVTVKNGTIIGSESDPIVRFAGITDRIPYEKTYDESTKKYTVTVKEETMHHLYVNLDGLEIIQTDAESTYFILLSGNSSNISGAVETDNKLNINNCTMKMKDTGSKKYWLGTNQYHAVDVQITGGTLEVNSIVSAAFSNLGDGTTVTMNKGADGKYLTLTMPKTADVIPTQTFTNDAGETVKFLFSAHAGEDNGYTLYELSAENKKATKYGNYSNTYSWEIFDKDGNYVSGGNNFHSTVAKATIDGCFVYLVKDTSIPSGSGKCGNNLTKNEKATITFDLGGHTLNTVDSGSTDAFIRFQVYKPGYETEIILKNGKIMVGSDPLVRFSLTTDAMDANGTKISSADEYVAAYENKPHKMKMTLENLDIETTSTTKYLFLHSGASTALKGVATTTALWDNSLTVKDCNVTISDSTLLSTYVSTDGAFPVKIEFLGGTIDAKVDWKVSAFSSVGGTTYGGYIKYGPGSNGEYTKYVSYGTQTTDETGAATVVYTSVPDKQYTDVNNASITDLQFLEYAKDETALTVTYLMSSLTTPYGTIGSKYASLLSNPWVIFRGNGTIIRGAGNFTTTIADHLAAEADGEFYIYLRRDYAMEEFDNGNGGVRFGKLNGSVTIDLNGHTVTMGSGGKKSTDAFLKLEPYANGYVTNITVTNGTFEGGQDWLVRFASVNTRTPAAYYAVGEDGIRADVKNPQTFNVTFDGVTINAGADANSNFGIGVSYSTLDARANATVKLKNCDINVTTGESVELCKSIGGQSAIDPAYIIEGGKITLASGSNVTWTNFNNSIVKNESLTFTKGEDGKYTTLVAFDGVKLPAASITNGYSYSFVKGSEKDGIVTYVLRPTDLNNFKVKNNVVLYSNFLYKLYVPALDTITSIVLGGTEYTAEDVKALEYTTIDGVKYYVLPVEVAPAEAINAISLNVTLNYNETYTGKWSVSVPKYAQSVLADGSADKVTKTLTEDVLSYILSAYTYFYGTGLVDEADYNKAKTLVESVIGQDYDANNAPVMAETAVNTTGAEITNATITLGKKLTFTFIVADGYNANDFVFKMGGAELETVVNGNTVTVSTYGYAVRNTVEYTVNGTDIKGSYNLKYYYDGADASVQALLRGLWKYSESAEAYKASVTK